MQIYYPRVLFLWVLVLALASMANGLDSYRMCINNCHKCAVEFNSRFDTQACQKRCLDTSGDSLELSCKAGLQELDKRSEHEIRICQKYCAVCMDYYRPWYNGSKCSLMCIETMGASIDSECSNTDNWS